MSKIKRSQSMKQPRFPQPVSATGQSTANPVDMVPRVDLLRDLRNNQIFKQQEQKLSQWENRRKSISLEDIRPRSLQAAKPTKEKSRSDANIQEKIKSTLLQTVTKRKPAVSTSIKCCHAIDYGYLDIL